MKKILFITYYWPPSGGAGVQRPLKFVKYLSQNGYEIHVLTVDPDKASYPVKDPSLMSEMPTGVKVNYVSSIEPLNLLGLFISKKKIPYGGFANTKENFFQKCLRFIRGNFFIPDARVGWARTSVKKAAEIIKLNQIDYVLISSPPHSSQLIGLKLKRLFPSIKWVADLRDPWTDIYYYKDLMHLAPARKLDAKYEKMVLENCDAALVVSPSIKKSFSEKSKNIDADKIHVIPNGYDESDFKEINFKKNKNVFTVVYTGTIADSYSPEVFFKILKEINNDSKSCEIRLRMIGSRSAGISALIDKYGLNEISDIINYVSHQEAIVEMQSASLLLLIIPDVAGNEGILTGKLFEYMGSGRPIIGLGPVHGDAATILNETGAGKMFSRESESEIKKYIVDEMSKWMNVDEKGTINSEIQKYSRRKQAEAVASIFSKLQTT